MAEKRSLSPDEKRIKRRQWLWLCGIGAVVLAVTAVLTSLTGPVKKTAPAPETKQISLGGSSADRDAWRASEGARIDGNDKQIRELRTQIQALETQLKRSSGEKDAREALADRGQATLPSQMSGAPTPAPPSRPATFPPPPTQPFRTVGAGGAPLPLQPATAPAKAAPTGDSAVAAGPSLKLLAVALPAGKSTVEKAGAKRSGGGKSNDPSAADGEGSSEDSGMVDTFVPSGSFVRAALLSGVDAPTGGGNQQQNPMPVLLRLQDDAQLPNDFRAALKGCFALGDAHGDLSTERALIRLNRLSCVDENGKAVDLKVAGFVTDETGRGGVRGNLVYKAGAVIANAITSGLLSGIGEGIRAESVQQNTTITGAVTEQVVNPWRAGLGRGVGKSFDRISEFYLKQADKLFPVISVDPGRTVELVFLKGFEVARQ